MTPAPADLAHMRAALALAGRGLGRVWPNPAVGCVLVREGRVVGRGWTQPGGRPHAETEALARAGAAARGATAYVSLEPCAHHGKTPPCADALIAAGIARAVVAVENPDQRVSGRGAAALKAAGIALTTGVLEAEAAELNRGFVLRVTAGRPLVTLKLATSLDGRIATHRGESQWITGEPSRRRAHLLRASHDAVMVGSGTALADDPALTCRLAGVRAHQPVRVVVDSRLRLPLTSRLVATAREVPTWLLTLATVDRARRRAYADLGVEAIALDPGPDGRPSVGAMLRALAERGITRVLVEGGGHLAAAMLGAGLVDRLAWFRAGIVLGGDGLPAAAAFGIDRLGEAPRFVRRSVVPLGEDMVESWTLAHGNAPHGGANRP